MKKNMHGVSSAVGRIETFNVKRIEVFFALFYGSFDHVTRPSPIVKR